jgi:hypothetical protein
MSALWRDRSFHNPSSSPISATENPRSRALDEAQATHVVAGVGTVS